MLNIRVCLLILCGLFQFLLVDIRAQGLDSSYFVSYENQITGRFYFSRKFTLFRYFYSDDPDVPALSYRPNTTLNMGIGATYKWATLNLAYGFGFLNPDEGKGDTRYLDLQFHKYGKKLALDVYGQFYDGYYLDDETLRDNDGQYYFRPDIKAREFGAAADYILNHEKLSYRAAFFQNEWQKKSAGSVLVGWELFFGNAQADSSIVPGAFTPEPITPDPNRITFFETGPRIGYAYTWVIGRHFFLTGSGTVSLDYGFNTIETSDRNERSSSFSPNSSLRLFGGYNSSVWAFSITYVNSTVRLFSNESDRRLNVISGNYRLNIVRRFPPSKRVRDQLNKIVR